jgi:hypothetical protein
MDTGWTTLRDVAAVLGGVLGVFNFLHGFWERRVRLRVVPKMTAIRGNGFLSSSIDVIPNGFPTIEITNLSNFPITIEEAGFTLAGTDERCILIPDPLNLLPKRLEPRTSIDVRATTAIGFPRNTKRAYATTQCGHTAYGDSKVFKTVRKAIS